MDAALLDYIETADLSDEVKQEARNFIQQGQIEEACNLIVNSLKIESQLSFLSLINQLDDELYILCVLRILLDYQPNWLLKMILAHRIIEAQDTRFASTLLDVLERTLHLERIKGNIGEFVNFYHYVLTNTHRIAGKAVIPHLKKHLFVSYGDTRHVLQSEAFEALTTIGGEEILDYFITLLKTDYRGGGEWPSGRDDLRKSLIKFGDQAVPPLLDILYTHPKIEKRMDAAQILKALGAPQAFDVFEPLVEALRQGSIHPEHTTTTFIALGQVDPLIELLHDDSGNVRDAAVTALGRLKDKKAVEPLIDLFWQASKTDDRFFIRWHIIRAFEWLDDPRALDIVLQYGSHSAGYDRFIERHGGRNVVERLIAKLPEATPDDYVILEAIGELGDKRAVAPLQQFLMQKPNPDMLRATTLWSLFLLGDLTAIRPYFELLYQNADLKYSTMILNVLSDRNKVPNRIGLLIEFMQRPPEHDSVIAIIEDPLFNGMRISLKGEERGGIILAGLASPNARLRYRSIESLREEGFDPSMIVDRLIPLLADETEIDTDKRICDTVAKQLERIGTPKALEALEQWRAQY